MSVRNRILAGVAGLALSIGMALPASGESLADALAAAYRNSNLLEQNRALLRAADEDVQQAVAALLPVVNFTATALSQLNAPLSNATLSVGLSASMTLLDFGRGSRSVAATRETVMATRAGLVSVEQNVLLNAVTAYMTLYSDLQAVSLQRNNVTVITQQLRAARERFELGDSTRTDVALAEARLAASRSALALAQGNVAIDREVFNLAVGMYPSSLDSPPSLPRLPATLEAAQEVARQNHPSISQVQHQVAVADLLTEIIQRQRYGTVTGSISAEHSRSRVQGLPDSDGSDIVARLGYSVPLYTGGAQSSAERQQVAQAQAQRSNLHQTMAIVRQSVAASWAQLQIARASVVASDQQISATQSAYDAVRAEAELGSRTTLDVLDAEQELLDARSSRIAAAANVQLAAYSLLASMGQLTVESLNLGIPTYDVEAYGASLRHAPAPATRSRQGDALDRIMGRYSR